MSIKIVIIPFTISTPFYKQGPSMSEQTMALKHHQLLHPQSKGGGGVCT